MNDRIKKCLLAVLCIVGLLIVPGCSACPAAPSSRLDVFLKRIEDEWRIRLAVFQSGVGSKFQGGVGSNNDDVGDGNSAAPFYTFIQLEGERDAPQAFLSLIDNRVRLAPGSLAEITAEPLPQSSDSILFGLVHVKHAENGSPGQIMSLREIKWINEDLAEVVVSRYIGMRASEVKRLTLSRIKCNWHITAEQLVSQS